MKNVVNILIAFNVNILFFMGISYYYFRNLLIFFFQYPQLFRLLQKAHGKKKIKRLPFGR